jgi:hypothetical protein
MFACGSAGLDCARLAARRAKMKTMNRFNYSHNSPAIAQSSRSRWRRRHHNGAVNNVGIGRFVIATTSPRDTDLPRKPHPIGSQNRFVLATPRAQLAQ